MPHVFYPNPALFDTPQFQEMPGMHQRAHQNQNLYVSSKTIADQHHAEKKGVGTASSGGKKGVGTASSGGKKLSAKAKKAGMYEMPVNSQQSDSDYLSLNARDTDSYLSPANSNSANTAYQALGGARGPAYDTIPADARV